ncbi:MAG: gliding motility-associated C-terminal domain-containing protein [Bacteroidales bacterium]
MLTESADSTLFNTVTFNSEGALVGNGGSAWAHKVIFDGNGKINASFSEEVNVYSIDSLFFNSNGYVYGHDTASMVRFASFGLIEGRGIYKAVLFEDDGNIFRNNSFDTLTFSPGHTYILQNDSVQTIVDSLHIVGNNCESIYLQSSGANQAVIFKESGSVYGNFIEMTSIRAEGGAVFDAGQFSLDVNNSNNGWVFYDQTLNYSLGEDQKMLEGDTILLCSTNFNGNNNSLYEWKNCNTGEVVGTDSCYLAVEQGDYCLTVFYNEGPGCYKSDDIYVGCYLKLDIDTSLVSCYGYSDGWIEINVEVGTDPIQYEWYKDGNLYAETKDIYELPAGNYVYLFKDVENCVSNDTVMITQPDSLTIEHVVKETCFAEQTGTIDIAVEGGTQPYSYSWSNGSNEPDLMNLPAGVYSVIVTDHHSCPEVYDTITIVELAQIEFELEGTDLICYNDSTGKINVANLIGGTGVYDDFVWMMNEQLFSQGKQDIDTLSAGKYTLNVIDDLGCNASNEITIAQPEPIILDLEAINGNISLGSIDLTVTGGTLPYEYLWSTGEITEDIDPLGGGIYTVEVTDGNMCKSAGSVFVEVHYRIYAPTAFSPNGDGMNDEFKIYGLGTDLRQFELTLFDRWGNEVFKTNDAENYWNGRFHNSGEACPIEVYTWMAKITYSTGEAIIDKGNVSLLK